MNSGDPDFHPDPAQVWVTRRYYPVNVIAEAARDVLWELAHEFLKVHPDAARRIAEEAERRLGFTQAPISG